MKDPKCEDCRHYNEEQNCCVVLGIELPPDTPVEECRMYVAKEGGEYVVHDSGKREVFSTGAVRDTADDKPRPDLVSPFFMFRLGDHLRKGAAKYSEWNWAKGIPSSRCFASCMRHLMAYAAGKQDEDHLSAAAFNIMVIIHNEETAGSVRLAPPAEDGCLNDMPRFSRDADSQATGPDYHSAKSDK